MTSLEEKIARSMCALNFTDADERMPNDGPRWRYYVPIARAAIAVCAEEMAKVAEKRFTLENVVKTKDGKPNYGSEIAIYAARQCAAAIRSMEERD